MPDKMTQEEAIEQANEFLEPNRNISWDKKEDIGTVIILLLKDKEAIKTLLSTARQVEEVVGKCKEEIEYYRKSLENENNKNRIKLKELALHFYEGMLSLLTEEDK